MEINIDNDIVKYNYNNNMSFLEKSMKNVNLIFGIW